MKIRDSAGRTARLATTAALFCALLAAPAAAAVPQACGCENRGSYRWPEHLQIWSNMVDKVRVVNQTYDDAMKVIEEAERARTEAGDKTDKVNEILNDAKGVADDAETALADCSTHLSRNETTLLAGAVEQLGPLFKRFDDLQEKWKELGIDAFVSEESRSGQDRSDRVDRLKHLRDDFEAAYNAADNEQYKAVKLDCVKREWETVKPIKERLEREIKHFSDRTETEQRRINALNYIRSDVKRSLDQARNRIADIAEKFGRPRNASTEDILKAAQDRVAERIVVEFSNVPDPSKYPALEIKKDDPEDAAKRFKVPDPPVSPRNDGPEFAYWTDASLGDDGVEFKEFAKPRSTDLQLRAVWRFRVTVDGFDALVFPASGPDESRYLSTVAESRELAEYEARLRAGGITEGKVFDGWRISELGALATLDDRATLRKRSNISQIRKTPVFTVTFAVPGGVPPPPTNWVYGTQPFPIAPPLPEGTNGFHYVRWSLRPDGKGQWFGGEAITNDITVYAISEADFKVRFFDEDDAKTLIGERGAKKDADFDMRDAPDYAEWSRQHRKPGRVLVEWRRSNETRFDGGRITEDTDLRAYCRDEWPEEKIRRYMEPLSSRVDDIVLAAADVALLVLLIALLSTGRGPRKPKPKKTEDVAGGAPKGEKAESADAEAKPEGGETPAA